jgi:phosphoenolpyruvate carboxylase
MRWRRRTPMPTPMSSAPTWGDRAVAAHAPRQALVADAAGTAARAVQVFGFHLATLDLRQSSDKHEAVVAELLRTRASRPTIRAGRAGRRALLLALLCDARPLRVRGAALLRAGAGTSWRSSRPRATALRRYGRQAIRHCIISHTEEVSDLLELLLLQKECGLMRGTLDAGRAAPT